MQARRYLLVLVVLALAALSVMSVSAQTSTVSQALTDIGTNCANLALNTTCIGHASVQRTTSSGLISTTYVNAGDRASITTTHRIATSPLNAATGDYGINVMKVQAGLPASSGGIVYVALGGTTLTNVGGAGQAVWQNISLTMNGAAGAPGLFLIQAPKGVAATVTVNGEVINLHSTVATQINVDGSVCYYVIEGSVVLNGVTVSAGYKSCVAAGGTVGAATLFTAADVSALEILTQIPGNVLDYPFTIPVITCPSGVGQANCTVTSG